MIKTTSHAAKHAPKLKLGAEEKAVFPTIYGGLFRMVLASANHTFTKLQQEGEDTSQLSRLDIALDALEKPEARQGLLAIPQAQNEFQRIKSALRIYQNGAALWPEQEIRVTDAYVNGTILSFANSVRSHGLESVMAATGFPIGHVNAKNEAIQGR